MNPITQEAAEAMLAALQRIIAVIESPVPGGDFIGAINAGKAAVALAAPSHLRLKSRRDEAS